MPGFWEHEAKDIPVPTQGAYRLLESSQDTPAGGTPGADWTLTLVRSQYNGRTPSFVIQRLLWVPRHVVGDLILAWCTSLHKDRRTSRRTPGCSRATCPALCLILPSG